MNDFSQQYVLDLIANQNALAKIVSVPFDSDRCLDFLLDQIADPLANRPIKNIKALLRHRFFNPKEGTWEYRAVEDLERGQPKNTPFTKKTSTMLLPYDGKIQFFEPKNRSGVGFIYDLNLCHMKNEKYIFPVNANTDKKWWIKQKGDNENTKLMMRSISIEQLKQQLKMIRDEGKIPPVNECLVGLSKESFVGVFALENIMESRLRALYAKKRVKKKLGIELPILIITPTEGVKVYDENQQEHDLRMASRWDHFSIPAEFLDNKLKYLPSNTTEVLSQDTSLKLADLEVKDLIDLSLDYLGLNDLLKARFFSSNNEEVKVLENKILKNRMADLMDLLPIMKAAGFGHNQRFLADNTELKNPNQYLELYYLNQDAFKKFTKGLWQKDSILKREELIERVLAHICHAQLDDIDWLFKFLLSDHPALARLMLHLGYNFPWEFLSVLCEKIDGKTIEVIIKNMQYMPIWQGKTKILGREYTVSESVAYGITININGDPLLYAVLANTQPEIIKCIAEKFPEAAIPVLNLFKKWYEASSTSDRQNYIECSYKKYPLNSARYVSILLQLNASQHSRYCLSYTEKRIIENHLIDSLNKLTTIESVNSFWNTHKNAIYLNQHRHASFDYFFRKNDFEANSKRKVKEAVQKCLETLTLLDRQDGAQRNPGLFN